MHQHHDPGKMQNVIRTDKIEEFLGPRYGKRFAEEFAYRGMQASRAAIVRDALVSYFRTPIKERFRDPRNQPSRGRRRRMGPIDAETGLQRPPLNPGVMKDETEDAT